MKQNSIILIILSTLLIAFTACKNNNHWIKGEGVNVNNSRMPGIFNGVSLSVDANVEIFKDSVCRIELNGQQNILNVIETRISGGVLNIGLERRTSIRKHNPITIKLFMPDINHMDISGSGSMVCKHPFSIDFLNTNISGSGNMSFSGEVRNSITANISGSGAISLNGVSTCNSAKYTISGSGNINADWLKINYADARISGSGDIRLYSDKELKADISGSGDIYYRGHPQLNVSISGSGKVHSLD